MTSTTQGNRVDGLPRIIKNPTVPMLVKAWRANPPKEEGE
jgi:hypothetical protein